MASPTPALKALPAQARRRIAKLESEVSELTGALGQVVSEMRRQGIVIPIGTSSPLLRRLVRTHVAKPPKNALPVPVDVQKGVPPTPSSGLAAAVARGEAARVEWVRTGEVVPARVLAEAWGLTPQALGPAVHRGELFAVVVKRQRYFPREFLDLDRDDVSAVCMALGRLSAEDKLVFWKRRHGALGGKTIVQALTGKRGGSQLVHVVQLAQARAAQAEADAVAPA
jgi:hypothetical protein